MKTLSPVLALALTAPVSAGLINGGFESFPVWGYDFYNGTTPTSGWATTAPDNLLEIWGNGFLGVPAYEGNSFAELNANYASTLFQHTNAMRFAFEAVSAVGGNTQGNLIDWCDFGVGVIPAPGAIALLAFSSLITVRRRA